MTSQLQI